VFGGLRSSIRLGGSKPYRAGSYRLTPASTGRQGKHVCRRVAATLRDAPESLL